LLRHGRFRRGKDLAALGSISQRRAFQVQGIEDSGNALAIVFATSAPQQKNPAHPSRGVWKVIEWPRTALDPFDAARPLGAAIALATIIALVIAARILARFDDLAPLWVAMNGAALVPLFATGLRAPPPWEEWRAARERAGKERAARERAGKGRASVDRAGNASVGDFVLSALGRIPREGGDPLEIRLSAMPRAPMPGLVAIELAHEGWCIVRVKNESAAHTRLLALERPTARGPGRTPDERVFLYENHAILHEMSERRSTPR